MTLTVGRWLGFGLVLLGAVGCGGVSTSGHGGSEQGPPELKPDEKLPDPIEQQPPKPGTVKGRVSERAFNVSARVELDAEVERYEDCLDFDFTARFREVAGDWVFEVASEAELGQATLQESKPGSYVGVAKDEWDRVLVMAGACGRRLELKELTLTGGAADVAGSFTSFTVTGSGELVTSCGDCEYSDDAHFTFQGSPDQDAPTLSLPSEPLHPLDSTVIVASEALLEVDGSLTPVSGVPVPAKPGREPLWQLELPPLLTLGSKLLWRADGSDWAGNALVSRGELGTAPDPGLLPQDGFETEVPAFGLPVLVEEGALSGARSLFIDRSGRVTVHLQRSGAKKLVFSYQPQAVELYADAEYTEFSFVQARFGMLGGSMVASHTLEVPVEELLQGELAAPVTIELPLPETGDDVIVSFDMSPEDYECGLLPCSDVSALIDDLRLE